MPRRQVAVSSVWVEKTRLNFPAGGLNFAPRVAAHEFGHILGRTTDHDKAESIGLSLLRQSVAQGAKRC